MNEAITRVEGTCNIDFMTTHGRPGAVCLVGGTHPVDRGIRRAQKRVCPGRAPSLWSHAFVLQGERADGHAWLLESDIDLQGGQVKNGVQEHRLDKYGDASEYPNAAILDFGLTDAQARGVIAAGLDFVSRRTRYAAAGALKTYWNILAKRLDREPRNKDAIFCSAFVRALYRHVGVDLVPSVAVHNTLPEHLAQTTVPHRRWVMLREEAER